MGNCLIRQDNLITVMKSDEKVLEHKAPMKVPHVLSEYSGDGIPVVGKLQPAESEGDNGIVRIKVVISKQELEVMLRKGGVSVADLVSRFQKKERWNEVDDEDDKDCGRWKPVLESIPELI